MLHVHALDRADPLREVEDLGLAERRRRVPATALLPDDRRVEALLDRRPDGERRGELVAVHGEVGAVPHARLVDLAEQLVLGIAGEDVRQAGLHPQAHQGQPARGLPLGRLRELPVAQLLAALLVRSLRVRVRERHRHVHVVHAGGRAGIEDRHDEPRVHGVEDMRDPVFADHRHHRVLVRGIHAHAREPAIAGHLGQRVLDAGRIVVGHHHVFEEATPGSDGHRRRADAAGPDHQDPHVRSPLCRRARRTPGRRRPDRRHALPAIMSGSGAPCPLAAAATAAAVAALFRWGSFWRGARTDCRGNPGLPVIPSVKPRRIIPT